MPELSLETQFGALCVTETDGAITRLSWRVASNPEPTEVLRKAVEQIAAYASGELKEFALPTHIDAAPLQRAVCQAMMEIPFGETRTYGSIAKDVGASAQAVGQACGGNPIPIIIPCHRVMGAGGKLTGFSGAGGVETKVALLRHENAAGLLI